MLKTASATLLVLCGCSYCYWSLDPATRSKLVDPQGQFTLYVRNGSRALDPVDIRVEVDGQVVKHGYFWHGNTEPPHMEKLTLLLQPGKHQLSVSSKKGEANLSREFEVRGKHWASITYAYRPSPKYGDPQPKGFFFGIRDEPMLFE